jgi:hypothetical protein
MYTKVSVYICKNAISTKNELASKVIKIKTSTIGAKLFMHKVYNLDPLYIIIT